MTPSVCGDAIAAFRDATPKRQLRCRTPKAGAAAHRAGVVID
jgi:hypothetical protein